MQLVHDFIVNAEWDFSSLQIVSHVSRNAATAEKPLINTKIRLKWRIFVMFHTFHNVLRLFSILSIVRQYCLQQSHFACF